MNLTRRQMDRPLVALALLVSFLSTACSDGSSNSPAAESGPTVSPVPGKADVLVYKSFPVSGPTRLYKVNRMGETTLLSGAAGDTPVDTFTVSPDNEQLAYQYTSELGQPVLAVVNLSTGDAAPPRQAAAGEKIFPQWLPNSQGLLYTVYDADNSSKSLFLATNGVADAVQLMTTESTSRVGMGVSISADSTRAAVAVGYYTTNSLASTSSDLYLLDLVAMDEPLLIASTSGDGNLFSVGWSPAGRKLLYLQSDYIGVTLPGASLSRPAGPLVLLGTDEVSQAIADYPNFFIFPWIDEQHFLMSRTDGFDLWDTEGTLLAAPARTGYWQVESSPDKRWLAWLAPEAGAVAVHLLNVETGETRSIGPASATEYPPGNQFVDLSTLHWSPDGSWLAWNRELDELGGVPAELYAYLMSTGETRLVSTRLSRLAGGYDSPWLPQGQRLGYFVHGADGEDLTITDLEIDRSYVVGSSAVTNDCRPTALWGPSNEALWYRCGEGLYVSRVAADGTVTEQRLIDGNVGNFTVSANHQIALLEPLANIPPGSLQPNQPVSSLQPNRMMYEFLEDSLIELTGTEGSPTFEFLQ